MDERLIGSSMARSLLGVRNYAVIQEMIRGGYIRGVWIGDGRRRRFVATADGWWEGYMRWRADHGLPPLEKKHRGRQDLSARQAAAMLGVGAETVQRLVREGYVTPRRGPQNSLLATEDEWREGFARFKKAHWGDTGSAGQNEDPPLSMTKARELLQCGREVVTKLVREGYVDAWQDRRTRAIVALRSEWIRGYRAYLAQGRQKPGKRVIRGELVSEVVRLTKARPLTVGVLTGMAVSYGRRPTCYVCGRPLREGDMWRWFVPAAFQPNKGVDPQPAFGCAEGHEGAVIEVAGMWFRIQPPGRAPMALDGRPAWVQAAFGDSRVV